MSLAHLFNVLALFTVALVKTVKQLGKRGLLQLVRTTLSAPWFAKGDIEIIQNDRKHIPICFAINFILAQQLFVSIFYDQI